MGFELDGLTSFGFIDMGTGERFELSDATIEIDTLSPNEVPDIRTFGTCEATFTCENAVINENLLSELFLQKKPNTFDLQYTAMVQARRHKKKRINKKWLKRYGYKKQQMTSKGWELSTYNTQTGEVEMVKRDWR
mgnify:FL=1